MTKEVRTNVERRLDIAKHRTLTNPCRLVIVIVTRIETRLNAIRRRHIVVVVNELEEEARKG